MLKIKFEREDVRWHEFTAEQKSTVTTLCVMSIGAGFALGLSIGFGV